MARLFVGALLAGAAAANPLLLTRDASTIVAGARRAEFEAWVLKHGKAYATPEEHEERFGVWSDNKDFVVEYNKKHTSHWLGMNGLADLRHEEFKATRLGVAPGQNGLFRGGAASASESFRYADVDAPDSVDWRTKGAVSEVKNQQQCGSCWAFSTVGSVEGINQITNGGKVVEGSEQELVDCDTLHDMGCNGGLMDYAFTFIQTNGGLDTESDYPYTGSQGTCDKTKEAKHVLTIDGFEDVPQKDEASLAKAVAMQPVSVAIEADQRVFQLYTGGILSDTSCGEQLDHGVLAVGYGTDSDSGMDFWIVKNSWGATWGEQGYIRLERNLASSTAGMCGIASQPSYPTKSGPSPGPSPGPTPGPSPAPGPSPPGPVKCDGSHQCDQGDTCCCTLSIAGHCMSWGCCPLPEATCCDDHKHCCPHDYPVCDVAGGSCGASDGLSKVPISVTKKSKSTSPRLNPFNKGT